MTHEITAPVRYDVVEQVAIVRIDRPEARNAINAAVSSAVGDALERADADPDVRAIVVTGVDDVFSAGADLKALAQGLSLDSPEHPEWGFAGIARHWIHKPLIAAVNGPALGGGAEIALACDLIVASDSAVFGLPEVRWGLFAAAGGVLRLPQHIGVRRTLELALTGDPIDAATALEWGIVNRVVPADRVLDEAVLLAGRIARNAPLSVRESKRVIHATLSDGSVWGQDWRTSTVWDESQRAMDLTFASDDGHEGMRAFAERRTPVWGQTTLTP
ncbi:enoyl-CoA hydratase-related protein [Microbacterium thalassium]|uniref:enoyl-CoA hydratase n=1 Tax=Microbacterium thalassium TaxID=362649 RepID=A0A7X0KTX4_9MICO|nr:enoyl-CoA hydratase-related protein [Microbacterium thalassium]MBB6390513.1 crotonobetainyl-CoA hydratase [Microbacterium thalassium]GLK25624.1 enoyl-CoA hydratase [Microbacterium thalassium]